MRSKRIGSRGYGIRRIEGGCGGPPELRDRTASGIRVKGSLDSDESDATLSNKSPSSRGRPPTPYTTSSRDGKVQLSTPNKKSISHGLTWSISSRTKQTR